MRHRSSKKYFNRDEAHRKALFRGLCKSLIEHESIKTTVAKAKYLRGIIEPLITKAKKDPSGLATRRYLMRFFGGNSKLVIEKLLKDLAVRFASRPGGYVRVLKCGFRSGDAAPMAYIQFTD